MDRLPLFRHEALDAYATQWMGAIRLTRPIGHVVAAALGLMVIAWIVSFGIFGSYTRRATVGGSLQPIGGVLRMTAPASGTIVEHRVVEGQSVAQGDVLFVLSNERHSSSGDTESAITNQLAARRAALEQDLRLAGERERSRMRATRERLAAIDVERAQLVHESDINAARAAIAEKNVERFAELARTGFVAAAQAQARLDDALVIRAQRENLKRLDANLQRERVGLASQIDESRQQADTERSEITRSLTALAREGTENEARRTIVVTAPYAAVVTGIAVRPGQGVAAGGLLATLIRNGAPLEAELFASTRQVGFVERGQQVRLRYAAYPYQKFGMGSGVVEIIEQSPYAPEELPPQVAATLGIAGLHGGEPVYRIVVALHDQSIDAYGHGKPLRPGMVFEADVIEDRRQLYEWLLEPIYGLAGR
jgi:membrane fusion protein